MNENLVVIENITKVFPQKMFPALLNIHAGIPKGQMVALAGPDGAGKTTLIRLIAGLLLPTQGKITVAGHDTIKDASLIHHLIGYMPQRFGLYEDLTVMQNLNLYADLSNVVGEEREKTIRRLLHFTVLEQFTDRLAGALSGGMKQKLGLACALIRKPTFLLLDEPSVGVDPISRHELWSMVQELLRQDITILWSTSNLEEAEQCNSVILLNEGEVLYYGDPHQLTNRVQERVFKISNIKGSRRKLLSEILQEPQLIDGIIQGSDLRVVTRKIGDRPLDEKVKQEHPDIQAEPTQPRFEDAFMDIFGGGPGGFSSLAAKAPMVAIKKENVVVAEKLTKKYGSFTAVEDISFAISRGEIFGLLGPNGAGKSTTFKMMCGLLPPTAGKAYVTGLDLQVATSQARSSIGYMAQKFSLYGNLSVIQNLRFFSGIYNLVGKKQKEAIDQMIEIFNLETYLNNQSELLPLGIKQRLALSCATMHHPDVLFLDEPTSGIDPITRREFWNHINGLVEKNVTVLVTTHFMEEAEYCDRIGLVYRGQMIKMGTPDELKKTAASPDRPNPTLEDAFIKLIEGYDAQHQL